MGMKKYVLRVLVLAMLIGVFVWMLVDEDDHFSDQENRNLAGFPDVTVESVLTGEFMSEFETYLADQFPVRNLCIQVKTWVFRLAGQRQVNDFYLGEDHYLIQKDSACDWEQVDKMVGLMNQLAKEHEEIRVSFLLAPTAMSVYEEKLPYTAGSSQLETMALIRAALDSSINYIDVYGDLYAERELGMYYKTDHHWTTRAAYTAFVQYAESLGINISDDDYEFYPVTNDFQGTCASGSGIYEAADTIEICVPVESAGTYVVNYVAEMKKTASLFEGDKLGIKDKYQVFMGGNHAQVNIKTDSGTGKNLLLVKDSYGNCMVSMLTPHFDNIVVVDPRYFTGDIYEVMQTNKINEVLFLYNVNSFVTDNSLDIMLAKSVAEK